MRDRRQRVTSDKEEGKNEQRSTRDSEFNINQLGCVNMLMSTGGNSFKSFILNFRKLLKFQMDLDLVHPQGVKHTYQETKDSFVRLIVRRFF